MSEQIASKKIEVKNTTKIFGKNSKRAAQLLNEGKTKARNIEGDWCDSRRQKCELRSVRR